MCANVFDWQYVNDSTITSYLNKMTEKKLPECSDKQKRLVNLLLADENMEKREAGIQAGYSEKTASSMVSQVLAKPHVQAYMQQQIDNRNARMEIDQDYVVSKLVSAVEMAMGDKPITISVTDKDGSVKRKKQYKTNLTALTKACELLGRQMGMFKDVTENTNINSLEKTMIDIAKQNAKDRKSLLPKDNIDFTGNSDD